MSILDLYLVLLLLLLLTFILLLTVLVMFTSYVKQISYLLQVVICDSIACNCVLLVIVWTDYLWFIIVTLESKEQKDCTFSIIAEDSGLLSSHITNHTHTSSSSNITWLDNTKPASCRALFTESLSWFVTLRIH